MKFRSKIFGNMKSNGFLVHVNFNMFFNKNNAIH